MKTLGNFAAGFLAFGLIFLVLFRIWVYVDSKTYTLYEVWPDGVVVGIEDPNGNKVKVLPKDCYHRVVWVRPGWMGQKETRVSQR